MINLMVLSASSHGILGIDIITHYLLCISRLYSHPNTVFLHEKRRSFQCTTKAVGTNYDLLPPPLVSVCTRPTRLLPSIALKPKYPLPTAMNFDLAEYDLVSSMPLGVGVLNKRMFFSLNSALEKCRDLSCMEEGVL